LLFNLRSKRPLKEFSLTCCSDWSWAMSKSTLLDAPGRITAPGDRNPGRRAATAGTARAQAAALGTASTKFFPASSR